MWDLDSRLDNLLFKEQIDVEPFKRGEVVGTKVDGEEKTGVFLGMTGSGKARVKGDDDIIYQVDPKVLYIPLKGQEVAELDTGIDPNQLEMVEEYFQEKADSPKATTFERVYSEKMLERLEAGISKKIVSELIKKAKKERLRQHAYEKRGDRRAKPKYKALERAIFALEQLL